MGIRGLTSFIDKNFHGWRKEQVKGKLVVDGYSLCHRLYVFEWGRGGQYPQYRTGVLEFFNSMLQCGIEPLVVFDGIDYKQEKVSTTLRRRQEWVKYIHSQTASVKTTPPEVYGNILPVLAVEVFQLALFELKVPVYVVDGEADGIIVEIANFLSCPVLACDSDYFIYRITYGYIPTDRFHWKASPIEAELFYISEFAKQFGFQHESLRFMIPGIAGNDFLKCLSSPKFLQQIADDAGQSSSKRHPLMVIVRFAGMYKSLDSFMSQKSDRLPNLHQVKANCRDCQKMYTCEKTTDPESLLSRSELRTLDGVSIPGWMISQYRHCSLNKHCMNVLVLGKSILRVVPDDSHKSSAFDVSLPVRQKTYNLLPVPVVTEYVRRGLDLAASKVYPVNSSTVPDLVSLPLLADAERFQMLCSILDFDGTSLSSLDEEWKFVAAVGRFWAFNADVPVDLVRALVYCNVLCFNHNSDLNQIRKNCAQSSKWMTAVHVFSQWQCCYFDLWNANQLLMHPLKVISPAFLYDGTVAHFIAQDVSTVLTSFPICKKLSTQLLDIILDERFCTPTKDRSPQKAQPQSGSVLKKTRKVRGSKQTDGVLVKKPVQQVESKFVHPNPFSLLRIYSESSSEDSAEESQ